jgi:hypothetical protein
MTSLPERTPKKTLVASIVARLSVDSVDPQRARHNILLVFSSGLVKLLSGFAHQLAYLNVLLLLIYTTTIVIIALQDIGTS